ncbi:MAG: hypothetical protein QGH20_08575, partial [Candidatus Latescibacteria bacterium]|nr:hypothetical protein [Candidatus Latescibacterota bacterium]
MAQLTIGGIITGGISIGFKNLPSVLGAMVLWLATIWIPYLNVGTTIAVTCGLVASMSRGEQFSPTEIFNARYRQYMGDYFLLVAILSIAVPVGFIFVVIPGVIIALAWSQSCYLLVDKGLSPMECLTDSNRITFGHKWTIFFSLVALKIILFGAAAVLLVSFDRLPAAVVCAPVYLIAVSIIVGTAAYIYGALTHQSADAS